MSLSPERFFFNSSFSAPVFFVGEYRFSSSTPRFNTWETSFLILSNDGFLSLLFELELCKRAEFNWLKGCLLSSLWWLGFLDETCLWYRPLY